MTIKSTLATAALAATVVLGFAAAANAATIQYDTKLYANPGSGQIGWVHEGQWVDVQGCYKNYCWGQKPGPDGFVRASAIDFDHGYDYGWWYSHPRPGFHFGPGFFPGGPHPHPGMGGPGACVNAPGFGFCVNP